MNHSGTMSEACGATALRGQENIPIYTNREFAAWASPFLQEFGRAHCISKGIPVQRIRKTQNRTTHNARKLGRKERARAASARNGTGTGVMVGVQGFHNLFWDWWIQYLPFSHLHGTWKAVRSGRKAVPDLSDEIWCTVVLYSF